MVAIKARGTARQWNYLGDVAKAAGYKSAQDAIREHSVFAPVPPTEEGQKYQMHKIIDVVEQDAIHAGDAKMVKAVRQGRKPHWNKYDSNKVRPEGPELWQSIAMGMDRGRSQRKAKAAIKKLLKAGWKPGQKVGAGVKLHRGRKAYAKAMKKAFKGGHPGFAALAERRGK